MISTTSTTTSTQSFPSKHRAPQPPPNTPLTPTLPTLNRFTSTLPSNPEAPEFDEPDTLTSYGDLTPVESYLPPMPPLPASPKRYAHGCLRLRLPVRRPPMPKRSTIGGYSYGGYGGWSRLVIGGDVVSYFIYDSMMRTHLTLALGVSEPNVTKGPFDTVAHLPNNTNIIHCQYDQPFGRPAVSRTSFPIATSHSPTSITPYNPIPSLSNGSIGPNVRFRDRGRNGVS